MTMNGGFLCFNVNCLLKEKGIFKDFKVNDNMVHKIRSQLL